MISRTWVMVLMVGGLLQLGYAQIWWQIAQFIAALVVSYALAPKPKAPKPAAFEDFDFPQFEEGTPQMVIFGDVWIEDWMVLTAGNYRNTAIKTKSGKK